MFFNLLTLSIRYLPTICRKARQIRTFLFDFTHSDTIRPLRSIQHCQRRLHWTHLLHVVAKFAQANPSSSPRHPNTSHESLWHLIYHRIKYMLDSLAYCRILVVQLFLVQTLRSGRLMSDAWLTASLFQFLNRRVRTKGTVCPDLRITPRMFGNQLCKHLRVMHVRCIDPSHWSINFVCQPTDMWSLCQ